MTFEPNIKTGDILDNKMLTSVFKCSNQGGMRRSLKTNTLVIISDPYKAIYEDRWISNVFHYTGMGMKGNQRLAFAQNKTLAGSSKNKVNVHLFEVHQKQRYTYIGEMRLADLPYEAEQPDADGIIRKVWMFPLKLKNQQCSLEIPEQLFREKQKKKDLEAKQLSDDILAQRVAHAPKKSGSRIVSAMIYERNAAVKEYSRRRANGICQLCEDNAPFHDKQGIPFLETHHIKWLSDDGEDSIENTVALCPNCHRKMHLLNLKTDVDKLKTIANDRIV